MAVLKCKMCGGELSFTEGATVCECEYCGSKQTLPRLNDERKVNLYDRAGHFRRNNDYDKAIGIYEQILNDDPTDAEAYWSLVLCRYGIEYVEDPETHKRVPTVNRAQLTSIYADEDYKAALAHADTLQKTVYEQEAAAIEQIQKGILAISAQEEPFDVFICYKETDENGRRTRDSVLATELYNELTKEDLKVFFARITLEDKIGSAYEPYIFAALHSAPVMVALGTKPEHFKAVWVKNEWSRYLTLIRQGERKTLVPAYKDMDPYDLPEEFSHLQALDMGKLGFMQDLIRGIKKLLKKDEPKPATVKETVVRTAAANTEPLLKRGYMCLEDGSYEEANGYFERVLDQDAENVRAYLGKLYASERVSGAEALQKKRLACLNSLQSETLSACAKNTQTAEALAEQCPNRTYMTKEEINHALEYSRSYPSFASAAKSALSAEEQFFAGNRFYSRALQFAGGAEKEQVLAIRDGVLAAIRERTAEETAKDADTAAGISAAYTAFLEKAKSELLAQYEGRLLKAYQNAKDKMTSAESAEAYRTAGKAFEAIKEYKDSAAQAQKCTEKADAIVARAKRKKTVTAVIIALIVALGALYLFVLKDMFAYNAAGKLFAAGQYEEAKTAYTALGSYKDSADMAKESAYQEAKALYAAGDYASAGAVFITIKGYKDVDSLLATDDHLLNTAFPGKIVTLGTWGGEPIEWQVLEIKEDGTCVLLSVKGLDVKPYNTKYTDVTWENCTLRAWLNGEFYETAFSASEKGKIVLSTVKNPDNKKYGTKGGNTTKDYVYLLSLDEVGRYFHVDPYSNDNRKSDALICFPTAFAKNNGTSTGSAGACWWWLRSPGNDQHRAAIVYFGGLVHYYGYYVYSTDGCVRPVVCARL